MKALTEDSGKLLDRVPGGGTKEGLGCILFSKRPRQTLLNIETWSDSVVKAVESVTDLMPIRMLSVADIPPEVIACVDTLDVPPGTRERDVTLLLLEQLFERAGCKVDAVEAWRAARGSTALMERLRARLRVELEILHRLQMMQMDAQIGLRGSEAEVYRSECRRRAALAPEKRTWLWQLRKLWYGEWGV